MLLVKLGGSVITDKRIYRRFREPVVDRIISHLPREGLLVVHGGGSFGHHLAKKYEITSGFEDWKREGFSRIGLDMQELNIRVLDALIQKGIPAVSIPPHAFLLFGEQPDMKIFREAVKLGFVPVTHGDIVFDAQRGINICSGDYLMLQLAREFRPEKTIFLTDVDGIYDRDPALPGANLITHLSRDFQPETQLRVKDVTGGMAGKIRVMREIANYSRVYVLNGFYPDRIDKVIADEDFIGTVVE